MSEKGKYQIFEETNMLEGEKIKQYGIEFYCGEYLNRISDISEDLDFVEYIRNLLETEDVDEEIALDVISDCVIERYTLK